MSLLFEDAEDPAAALRWNLGQVRRLMGEPASLRGPVLMRPPSTALVFDVDVVLAGRSEHAAELSSIGGELLAGLQFPDCPSFETWLLGERRHLTCLTEALLQEVALTRMSGDDFVGAVRPASRLVALNPRDETHQELLIRAYALSGDAEAARRQLGSAVRLFRREFGCDPGAAVFRAAEARTTITTRSASPARARALLAAGEAQVAAGSLDAAVQVIRAACDEAERIADSSLIAQAHLTLGATLVGSGMPHHQEGELALHRAIAVADSVPEPFTAAASYRHLAASDALRGHYTRADRYLVAAEARGAADPSGTVEVAAVRGVSLTDQGQFDRAMSVFEQGLAADPARSHRFLPLLLAHAGRAALLNGDFVTAQKYLEESLGVANARSWAGVVAAPIALLGHVAVATAALTTAKELLDDAFARACQIGDACWETWAAHGLGLLAEAEGDPEGALVHLADAVARSEPPRAGHLWSHVWALSDATRLAQLNADDREAVWREAGLALAQRCGMQSLAARLAGVERPIVNSSLG